MSLIECKCGHTDCSAYKRCCFLPTEYFAYNGKVKILFVGQGGGSGNYLRDMVIYCMKDCGKSVGIAFSNTIRDNPDKNRVPTKDELKWCLEFLENDINELQKLGLTTIMPLGKSATESFLVGTDAISKMCGKSSSVFIKNHSFQVVPTFHPSYLMRQSPGSKKFDSSKLTDLDKQSIDDITTSIMLSF